MGQSSEIRQIFTMVKEFREAISVVRIPKELLHQLHDYHLHPVVLDYVMQLIPGTMVHELSARPQFLHK